MDGTASFKDEAGFTLVEVMIAATVMLVAMLGVLLMLDQASLATYSAKAREQGISLQRELVESARSLPYDQLAQAGLVTKLQSGVGNGLGDNGDGAGWTIRRRGITYSVTVGVCSVDDPVDGKGAHDAATFCSTGTGGTTADTCRTLLGPRGPVSGTAAAAGAGGAVGDCGIDRDLDGSVDNLVEQDICGAGGCGLGGSADATPEDYKRIVSLVRWDKGTGWRYAVQTTTVPNPGGSSAPALSAMSTTASDPITSATSASFSATSNRAAATVAWFVDGTQQGAASGSGTAWSFSWALGTVSSGAAPNAGEVLDGSYVVSAKAFDTYGSFGQARALTLRLNRRAPYAPARFEAGRSDGKVDLQWAPSPERDVEGYRVFRRPASGADVEICALQSATSCQDAAPPATGSLQYYAVAVDRDTAGNLRAGTASELVTVTEANQPPAGPPTLTASLSGGNVVLLWSASPGDPDGTVDHYRIYRDGTAYGDRYDRTSGTELTFTDTRTSGQTHSYYVAAVDTQLGESVPTGPVVR